MVPTHGVNLNATMGVVRLVVHYERIIQSTEADEYIKAVPGKISATSTLVLQDDTYKRVSQTQPSRHLLLRVYVNFRKMVARVLGLTCQPFPTRGRAGKPDYRISSKNLSSYSYVHRKIRHLRQSDLELE